MGGALLRGSKPDRAASPGCSREGARQGSAGFVGDWVAESLPWGFSMADIAHR